MRNIWLVAQREFLINVRKKSFLFAVFGMPIMMGVLMGIVIFATVASEVQGLDEGAKVGYVDSAEILVESVAIPENFSAYADDMSARAALDEGVLQAYFILPPVYMATGTVSLYSYESVSLQLKGSIEDFLVANLTTQVTSSVSIERLQRPVENHRLFLENNQRELTDQGLIGLFLVPILFSVVIMIGLQLSSTYLMSGVVEEKTNRIMEILITSIKPYELLTGKILGLSVLGLLQIVVWLVIAGILLLVGGNNPFLASIEIPLDFLALAIVYFLLTYLMLASLLAGLGAIVGSEQESRTYAGILSLVISIPFFFLTLFLTAPDSPIITALTLIPFTSAMTIILKMPFAPVPTWQIILSFIILLVTTIVIIWLSAKIFRWGILLYGKKASPKALWHVIRGSAEMGTIPTQGGKA